MGVGCLTIPVATLSWEKERCRGVDVTWSPKNVAVLRNLNFTMVFTETISVGTPEESTPA